MAVTLSTSWTLITEVTESPSDLSGSIFNRVYGKIANQSITANTTTIDYEWRVGILYNSSTGVYSNYNRSHSFEATGNTTENYSEIWKFGGRYYTKGQETVKASFSITVAHDDSGTYSKTQTMTFGGWNNATKTASQTVTLPTIPRYSTLSVPNYNLGSSVTATVTQQASTFSSIVYYRYPSLSSTWVELGRRASATTLSISGTPTDVCTSIPTANSITAEFKVRTYTSSDYTGTYLETTPTTTVTASVPTYSPSCTVTSATEGNTAVSTAFPSLGGFVIGQSKLTVTGGFTSVKGGQPASYAFTYNGSTKTVASTSTSASTTFDSVVSGQTTVSLQVTDSRGKTSSSATRTITLYSYSTPTVSITVTRGNLSGSTFTADEFGTAVQVKASWSASSVNSQNSVQSIVVKVGSTTKITYTPSTLAGTNVIIGTSTGYSTDSAYTFTATITDKLTTGTGSATLAKPTARDSTITVPNYTLGSSVTASVVQQSANFSTIVYYRYPSISSTWTELGRANGSKNLSISGTPTNVSSSLPSSTSTTAEFKARTYLANNYSGSYLETSATSATASVPSSYVPTASLTVAEGVSAISTAFPNLGGFIVGRSKIRGTGTCTGSNGSTPASYAFTYNSHTKTVATTATSTTATSDNYVASGATTVTLMVTDSRGRTGTASRSITLYTYEVPTLQISLTRGTVSGSTFTADVFGTACRVQAKWSVSSVNSQNSAQSIVVNDGTANRITYTPSSLTADWTTIGTISSVTYDAGTQYTFTATLTDKLTTASATAILATSKMPISLYDNNGTVGASVGQMASDAEANLFNVYLTSKFNSHVYLNKLIRSDGDMSKTILANVTASEVTEKAGGTAPTTTQDYLKFMLMCICDKYVGYTNTVFRGYGTRASNFYYEVFIYNTSARATNGLPNYAMGHCLQYSGGWNSDFGSSAGTFWATAHVGYNTASMGYLKNQSWVCGSEAVSDPVTLWIGNHNATTTHTGASGLRLSNTKAQPIFTLSADGVWGLFDNTPTNTTNGTTKDYKYLIGKNATDKMPFVNIRNDIAYTDANDILPPYHSGGYYNGAMTMGKLGSSGTNNPLTGYAQTILGYRYDSTDCFQIAFAISAYPIVHMRTYRNGTWQPWELIGGGPGPGNSAITRTSGASITTAQCKIRAGVVSVYGKITDSSNTYGTGAVMFKGTIVSGYRPRFEYNTCTFYEEEPIGINVTTAGVITIKNISSSSYRITNGVPFCLTYVI